MESSGMGGLVGQRRPKAGDVFQIPVDDDRAAYGQVLSTKEFLHLVVFDGLHDPDGEHDLDEVLRAPVIFYAWTRDDFLRNGKWPVVESRVVEPNATPPVEFIEMAEPDEFQAVDWVGNVLRPASPAEVENAPFRSINSPKFVQEAVEAWHGGRPWQDKYLSLRPWEERNAERDDEATRLLRRFRGQEDASESPDPDAEKIHYFVFADKDLAFAAERRLRELGQVSVDTDDSDSGGAYCLIAVSTSGAASPSSAELEELARELEGEYDGSETELR
jgi:Immunity protein 26/Regulator of ribonuclease activity B